MFMNDSDLAGMMKEVLERGAYFDRFELQSGGYEIDYQGASDYGAGHCWVTKGSDPTVYLYHGYSAKNGLTIFLKAIKGEPIEGAIDAAIKATESQIERYKRDIERKEQELQKLRQMREPLL